MRLFIAAELPTEVHEALCETSALLRDAVRGRYVPTTNFHVTLAFLGEVPGSQVVDVVTALEEGCAGQPPIKVALGPLGSFGKKRRATLWQGFATGVDELGGLAGDVRECLVDHGLNYDPSLFVPHVTLMRVADLTEGTLPMPVVEKGTIDTVTLFSSDLSGPAPRYEPLHRTQLEGEPDPQ